MKKLNSKNTSKSQHKDSLEGLVSGMSSEMAIKQGLEVSGSDEEEVYKHIRGRGGNAVRSVAAWWMVEGAGISHAEVAKTLRMSTAAVYRSVRRVKSDGIRKPYSDIVKWARTLEEQRESDKAGAGFGPAQEEKSSGALVLPIPTLL